MRVISFTLWPFYPLYPLSTMLARTQPASARWKISHLAPFGIEALLWRQVRNPVTVFTELFLKYISVLFPTELGLTGFLFFRIY